MICDMCGNNFDVEKKPGALFFSKPDHQDQCVKYHICRNCENRILDIINGHQPTENVTNMKEE